MTREYLGFALLDVALLAAGYGLLAGAGLVRSRRDAVRLAGLAFLAGWAAVGILGSFALMLGLSLAGWQVLLLCVLAGAVAAAPVPWSAPPPAEVVRGRGGEWLAVTALALLAVYLGALLRRALTGTASTAYDAWAFWLPKARSLVYFDGIDTGVGGFTTFAHPAYPPLVTALEATSMRFAGTTEASILPVQHWLVGVAFLGALAGLLAPRVRPAILYPSLAALALMPMFPRLLGSSIGDEPLVMLFSLGGVCGALWLVERVPQHAALAALFLSAAALAKKEGLMLGVLFAVMLAAAAAAQRRPAWRAPAAIAAAPIGVTAAWRVWLARHDIAWAEDYDPLDLFRLGYGWDRIDRLWTALADLPAYLLEPDRWLLAVPAAVAAALLAARRDRGLATLVAGVVGLGFLGAASIYWISPLPLEWYIETSAERVMASFAFFCAALFPLLLARAAPADDE